MESLALEHGKGADIGKRGVDAFAARINGVGLDRRGSERAGALDRPVKQCPRHPAPSESRADEEADDSPDRAIVHGWYGPGANEPLHLGTQSEPTPPDDPTFKVSNHTRRRRVVKLISEGVSSLGQQSLAELGFRSAPILAR